jgi:hypothetical protein
MLLSLVTFSSLQMPTPTPAMAPTPASTSFYVAKVRGREHVSALVPIKTPSKEMSY